jgi:hypothetical protein
LLQGHFKFLRDQVGFKLGAMLASREPLSPDFDEILFGDDAETDAFVYSLYADLCAGRVPEGVLLRVLQNAAVVPDDVPKLLALADRLPKRDHCRRIFIHLDRMSSPETFQAYGPRVCPFYNYFQPTLVLLDHGGIDAGAALRVAADLVIDQAFTADALSASYIDLARRGQLSGRAATLIQEALRNMAEVEFAAATPTLQAFGAELADLRISPLPQVASEPIDYVALLARERSRAKAAKLRVLCRL